MEIVPMPPTRRKSSSASPDRGQPNKLWRDFLSDRGLKASKARDAVVAAFLDTEGHVGLQALYDRAKRRHPGTGFATVYRAMKLLEEAGIAHARHFNESGETLYEVAAGRSHHDHLICEGCGRIQEFESPEIERFQDQIAARYRFSLSRHRHELYGLCAACAAKQRRGTRRPS
jgi:Fur family transcriptional regulator, ferric uptake regulator